MPVCTATVLKRMMAASVGDYFRRLSAAWITFTTPMTLFLNSPSPCFICGCYEDDVEGQPSYLTDNGRAPLEALPCTAKSADFILIALFFRSSAFNYTLKFYKWPLMFDHVYIC